MQIRLGGRNFTIATDRNGNPQVDVGSRPSQPSDAAALQYVEWVLDGHDLNSFEVIPPGGEGGYLGRDYGVNTDGRWLGLDTLGPLVNTIPLGDNDMAATTAILGQTPLGTTFLLGPRETLEDSTGMSVIAASGGTFGYIIRGSRPAKVDLSTMTLVDAGVVFDTPATDIITTFPADVTVRSEVSIALGSQPYQVLQEPGVGTPPAVDAWAPNLDDQLADVFGAAPDRTVAFAGNVLSGNIQTGTVTMLAPNWQTVTTITTQKVRGTGFALDGNLWVPMTTDGPYMLEEATGIFFPLMPELDLNDANGRNAQAIFGVGVVIPLELSLRWQRYGSGESFGPETYPANTSPLQGTATGLAGSPREMFTTIRNPSTLDTYLVVWKPQETGHDRGTGLTPFIIARFTGIDSRFLSWIGTVDGLRTNPTLMGGYDSNAFWITCGRTSRWIDDSNYRYASSGSTYLTEMRRMRNVIIDIEFAELEVAGTMGASQTVAVYLSMDGGSYTQIGATQTSTGFKRLIASSAGVPQSAFQSKHRVKPRIDYATNSSSASPQAISPLRLYYRTRPTEINVFTYVVDLPNDPAVDTPYGYEEFLYGLSVDVPQACETHDRQSIYVRVKEVTFSNIDAAGNSNIDARGLRRQARLTLEEWTTS